MGSSSPPLSSAAIANAGGALSRDLIGTGSTNPWQICATRQNAMANAGTRDGGTVADKGRVQRISHVACGNITALRLKYTNTYNGSNGETANTNPIVVSATIEYPIGTTVYRVTFGGRLVGTIDGGSTLLSDPVAVSIPAGATFYERVYVNVAIPPNVAVAAGTGGSLSAATYYYRVTAVTDIGESGGSVEVSAAVSAAGTAVLTLTDSNVALPTRYYNIYRSTTTNAEVLLTQLPGYTTSWTDTGAISPGATTVPAQQYVPRGTPLSPGMTGEGQVFNASSYTSYLNNTGAGPFSAVTSTAFSACAIYGVGTALPPSVALIGDSIISGTGDNAASVGGGYNQRGANDCGFAVRVLDAAVIPHISLSQGSETLVNFQGAQRQNRLPRLIGAKHVISNYGTNSLGTVNVANMKAAILEIAAAVTGSGSKIWWCTLNPKTTSTDNWTTTANQTPLNTSDGVDPTYNTPELRRVAINTWLRDTSVTGFVAQAGGASIAGVFDTASLVEVDATNTITLNGGRYLCAAAQTTANYGTVDGIHPSTTGHIAMGGAVHTSALN